MKNMNIIAGAFLVVGLGAGFFGGMQYQKSQGKNQNQFFQGGPGQMRTRAGNGNANGMRATTGEIISQDEKSITIKLQDGSSKIVLLPDSITVNKTDPGSKSDLKTGVKVAVFGTENSDGSVTASSVSLNPQIRGGQATPGASLR